MTLGQQITALRKKKKFSQGELGKLMETSGDIIGRYERDEVKPSIEVVIRMADVLEVSLDYLVGKTTMELDNSILSRIQEIQKLPADIKEKLFYFIDMSIRDYKAKQAYGH
ncbi:helix-turn-helix transcriptional regulator [Pedobacter hiemivivus]|uniref:Helix-turn-helix transcriptional regulator n=1 Tax=Pedobacter hiemivivus TaxID=2530454 RepID=A0A4U1FYE7_9SPHI|nr:helix-turn-helix transcriptional regulator [Pedobacter hiemivivus]TKC54873.1 helix-turn-helix transcriptional regulator [Pedobacter hiemivivus]